MFFYRLEEGVGQLAFAIHLGFTNTLGSQG